MLTDEQKTEIGDAVAKVLAARELAEAKIEKAELDAEQAEADRQARVAEYGGLDPLEMYPNTDLRTEEERQADAVAAAEKAERERQERLSTNPVVRELMLVREELQALRTKDEPRGEFLLDYSQMERPSGHHHVGEEATSS